jgi:AraC family transcriptional regulator
MQTPVEKALWFIEIHFSREITLDEVAGVCGVSRFQMSRLFSGAVGLTVTRYVRGRRLTKAARALAHGTQAILAVALDAGYGSHEAFSRAFRDQFGMTPAEVRAGGHLDGISLIEPVQVDPKVRVKLSPPRFETPGPLLIAGVGRRLACDDFADIPLYGRSCSRISAKAPARREPWPTGWLRAWRTAATATFTSPASRSRTYPISTAA